MEARARSRMTRRLLHPVLAAAVAATVLLSGVGPARPVRAAPAGRQVVLDYSLTLDPAPLSLCVGGQDYVIVTLWGNAWSVGEQPPPPRPQPGAWIRVRQDQRSKEIAEVSSDRLQTIDQFRTGHSRALFTITGKKLGTTALGFKAEITNHPEYAAADPVTLTVKVTSCYEVQASALGTQWPVKDVCDASAPYKLEGSTPGLSSTATLSFFPESNDPGRGTYILVQKAAVICRDESRGLYTFTEYPGQKKAEIRLSGPSASWCPYSGAVRTPDVGYAIQLGQMDSSAYCGQVSP